MKEKVETMKRILCLLLMSLALSVATVHAQVPEQIKLGSAEVTIKRRTGEILVHPRTGAGINLDGSVKATSFNTCSDGGSTDAYACSLKPALTAYVTGQVVWFKANTINTGAASLNLNALGAKTIKKQKDIDLANGDIKAGQWVAVQYDGTNFQMLSPVSNAGVASLADLGVTATAAELNQLAGVKKYVALLTQSGTSAPVATELENTLGGTVVWTRLGAGQYRGTLTGAFLQAKTWYEIKPFLDDPASGQFAISRENDNSFFVISLNGDDFLDHQPLQIIVYP